MYMFFVYFFIYRLIILFFKTTNKTKQKQKHTYTDIKKEEIHYQINPEKKNLPASKKNFFLNNCSRKRDTKTPFKRRKEINSNGV